MPWSDTWENMQFDSSLGQGLSTINDSADSEFSLSIPSTKNTTEIQLCSRLQTKSGQELNGSLEAWHASFGKPG